MPGIELSWLEIQGRQDALDGCFHNLFWITGGSLTGSFTIGAFLLLFGMLTRSIFGYFYGPQSARVRVPD